MGRKLMAYDPYSNLKFAESRKLTIAAVPPDNQINSNKRKAVQ